MNCPGIVIDRLILSTPIASEGMDRKDSSSAWIATAGILRNGGQSGALGYTWKPVWSSPLSIWLQSMRIWACASPA